MSEWKEVKLGDYIDMTNGYAFKSKSFVNRGIPVLKIKNIKTNKIIIEDIDYISADDNNPRYTIIKPNDLIITMTGNRIDGAPETWVGKVALFNLDGKYFLNQRLSIIRVKKDLVNLLFILYSLTTIDAQKYFITHATSSGGQANISPDIVKNFTIKLPSYIIQSEIAGILSSLDAKIETNNKLNEKLEEMAQAIFKSWFVDFEPFKDKPFHETELGMIPEGWEVKNIDHLYDIKYGNNLSTSEIKKSGQYPVYGANGVIGYYDVSNCNDYSVLITSRGNGSGDVYRTHSSKSYVTNNSFIVKPKSNYSWIELSYIYYSFLNINFKSYTNGSAQPQLTNKSIHNIDILLPSKKEIQNFCNLTMPIVYNIELLMRENARLASLRDTLLPRLMSGELIV